MKYKYQIMTGIISFFIGLSVILQKMYWNSISGEIVYYIISIVLVVFANRKKEVIYSHKISLVLWYVGFFVGYGIDYLYM